MDHKEFDDIVGKKLGEDQQFPFDENQWAAVESQLKNRKKRRGIIWWYWGAAAAAILLVGIGVNSFFLQKRINQLENQVNEYQNLEARKISDEASDITLTNSKNETLDLESGNTITKHTELVPTRNSDVVVSNTLPEDTTPDPLRNTQFYNIQTPNNTPQNRIVQQDLIPNTYGNSTVDPQSADNKIEKRIVENQADLTTQTINNAIDWSVFNSLDRKSDDIAEINSSFEFSPIPTKIKNKFGVKSFTTGLGGQLGWGISNVTSGIFNQRSQDAALAAGTEINQRSLTSSASNNVTNLKWWSQLQFPKGFGLRTEIGWKKITVSVPTDADALADPSTEVLDMNSNIFIAESTYYESNSAGIVQSELVLGAGLSYAPFRKWKLQPYISILPEFSWNAFRREDFTFPSNSGYSNDEKAEFDFRTKQFHLRNLSTRLGIQGNIAKKLSWHFELGTNLPVNAINPLLLNKYHIGAGVGYRFW